MTNPAIRVENLSKQYRIGGPQARYKTIRETISDSIQAPFRRVGKLLRGQAYGAAELDETIWALKDVSFEVKPGEVVGIIGRNGAGKSTLLKILSRITDPTEGSVDIFGRVGSLLEVGTGFHPELTGRENITLNGAIMGMRRKEIERKFDEIVNFAEIEKFIDTPVKHYSSGMYVRLAFAVAAHLEPEILLVDEVLSVGDAAFQKKSLGKMGNVAQEGRTVIFVSHNMGAVNSLCSKAIHLENGQIREFGYTNQIITNYLSELLFNEVVNLEKLRLPGYSREVKLTNIELLSGESSNIKFGQKIEVLLSVISDADRKDISIGSSIYNITGNCIGSFITEETFTVCANKERKMRLTISNLNIAPGLYHAGFSVGYGGKSGPRKDWDVILGIPAFQILPVSDADYYIGSWASSWGNIVINDTKLTIEQ